MAGEAVELMCRVEDCETIRIAAGTARTKGDVFAAQDALVFANDDFDDDEEVVGVVKAEHVVAPKAAGAHVAGDDEYFTAGAPGSVSNVVGGRKCGHCKEAAAIAAATVEMAWDGYGS